MTQAKQHIPKLRFPEFEGEWTTQRLGNLIDTLNGLTYSPADVSNSGILILRSSNVQNSKLCFEDNVYVNLKVDPKSLTQKGDILLCVRNGSRRLIGKAAYIDRDLNNTTHGAFMSVLRGENNLFLFQVLQGQNYLREVHKNLGATINSINGADLKKFKFPLPASSEEQQKIANSLTTVDLKIGKLERKKALLTDYKKGALQKIFTQEIRFKDNQGNDFPDWEEKKLGEVGTFRKGKGISKSDVSDKGELEFPRDFVPVVS